jgi:hypothetical protein
MLTGTEVIFLLPFFFNNENLNSNKNQPDIITPTISILKVGGRSRTAFKITISICNGNI